MVAYLNDAAPRMTSLFRQPRAGLVVTGIHAHCMAPIQSLPTTKKKIWLSSSLPHPRHVMSSLWLPEGGHSIFSSRGYTSRL